jgi:hypothetical protein
MRLIRPRTFDRRAERAGLDEDDLAVDQVLDRTAVSLVR